MASPLYTTYGEQLAALTPTQLSQLERQQTPNSLLHAAYQQRQQQPVQQQAFTPTAYNPSAQMIHTQNLWAGNDPTGYFAAVDALNRLGMTPGKASEFDDTQSVNYGRPTSLEMNSVAWDPWTGRVMNVRPGMTTEHLMNLGGSSDWQQMLGKTGGSTPQSFQQALTSQRSAEDAEFLRRANEMISSGARELTTPEQLAAELKKQAGVVGSSDDIWQRPAPTIADPMEAAKKQSEVEQKWGDFSNRYLPSTLRNQIQGHVDAGMNFEQTGLVGSNDHAVNRVTAALASAGITDLGQIGVAPDGQYYDKKTGAPIHANIMNFKGGSGDGNLNVQLRHNDKGQVYLGTDYNAPETSFIDDIMPQLVLAFIGGMAGPAIGGALGSAAGSAASGVGAGAAGTAAATTAGNALGYGLAGGTTAAAGGGNFGQGFLGGAIGGAAGGIGSGANQFNLGNSLLGANAPAWQQAAVNQAASGALRGGLQAALGGGDALGGILTGGLGGAASGALGGLSNTMLEGSGPLARTLGQLGTGALNTGIQSSLRGGDFGQGAVAGLAGGLSGLAGRGVSSMLGGNENGLRGIIGNVAGNVTNTMLRNQLRNKLIGRS